MRLGLKRTLSGLLAFVLMLSSLVVVNTACVSAAEALLSISEAMTCELLKDSEGNTLNDKNMVNLAAGKLLAKGYVQTVDGNVVQRTTDDSQKHDITYLQTSSVDSNGKARGVFKFKTAKSFKLTIPFASTGPNNTSDIAVRKSGETNVSNSVDGGYAYKKGTSYENDNLVINDLPAGEYEIYSPCLATEPGTDGTDKKINRGARIEKIIFSELEKEHLTEGKTYLYFADANTDAAGNDLKAEDCNNAEVFITAPTGTYDITPAVALKISDYESYKVTKRSGSAAANFNVVVPDGVENASIFILATFSASNSGTRSIKVTKDSKDVATITLNANTWETHPIYSLSSGTYNFSSTNNNVQIAAMALVTDEEKGTSISGTVMQTGTYEDVAGYEVAGSNVSVNDTEKPKKGNSTVKVESSTVSKPIEGAKVTIKGVADTATAAVNQTVDVNPENGSYILKASDTVQLPDGAYTVSAADRSGNKIGSDVTVNINDGKADKSANFTVEKNVTITFKTNIKDFKTALSVKSGNDEVFTLDDVTYHVGETGSGDIARLESVTHKVQMPVGGTYTINNNSSAYNIASTADGAAGDIIEFTADKNKTVNIYFKSETAKDVSEYVEAAETAGVSATTYATRGTYTFTKGGSATGIADEGATGDKAGVVYTLNGKEDSEHNGDMYGFGYGTTKNTSTRGDNLTLENDKGYIVFRTNETYVAKIMVEAQLFTLVSAEGEGHDTINGTSMLVIDSRYKDIGIILEPGTYVLYTSSTGEGYVRSIELNTASPFEVTNAQDVTGSEKLNGNSKMIIGTFNALNPLENYDKFAIIISANKDALAYANITNDITTNNDAENGKATSTDEYKPKVYDMKVRYDTETDADDYAVRDETTTLFRHIYDAKGNAVASNDKDSEYYYATIIENITGEHLYAVGAAKSGDKGKWMVQSDVFDVMTGAKAE